MSHYPLVPSTALFLFLLLGCLFHCRSTHARPYRPVRAYSPHSSFIDGQAFYIGGGKPFGGTTATYQTFAIDLSMSWGTTNPKFIPLPDGIPARGRSSAISADGKQWIVGDRESVYAYDIEKETWAPIVDIPAEVARGTGAATDPETGFIYIPNAFPGLMMKLDLKAKAYTTLPMPPLLKDILGFNVAWSTPLRKLLYFGGESIDVVKEQFYAYSYSATEGWKDIHKEMKGQIPNPRTDSCLTPAHGGSKMLLFGGESWDGLNLFPDIHVLDVATMTWRKGTNVGAKDKRSQAACAVSGDYFISWGGLIVDGIPDTTIVYSIKTNRWTKSFIAASPASTATTIRHNATVLATTSFPTLLSETPLTEDAESSTGTSRVSLIAAPVLGVAAVTLAGVILSYRARRRHAQNSVRGS